MDQKLKELFNGARRKADRVIFDKKINDIKRGIKRIEESSKERKRNPQDYNSRGNLTEAAARRRVYLALTGKEPQTVIEDRHKQDALSDVNTTEQKFIEAITKQ